MSRVRRRAAGANPLVTIPPVAGHLGYEVVMPTTRKKPEPTRHLGRYPKEFRRDAAAPVIDRYRTIAVAARAPGVVEQTLGNRIAKNALTAASARDDDGSAQAERRAAPRGEAPDDGAQPAQTKCVAVWVKELDR